MPIGDHSACLDRTVKKGTVARVAAPPPAWYVSRCPTWAEPVSELVFLVEEAPEGGYTARALGESIVTEADDLPALRDAIRAAVRCHFDPPEMPKLLRLHPAGDEVIAA
jgi:hypothetical protein